MFRHETDPIAGEKRTPKSPLQPARYETSPRSHHLSRSSPGRENRNASSVRKSRAETIADPDPRAGHWTNPDRAEPRLFPLLHTGPNKAGIEVLPSAFRVSV